MNRRNILTLTTVGLLYALAAPAFAQDAKSIGEQQNQKWLQAYNAGDAAALTALYTKDAALLPQAITKPLIGEANIRKYFDDLVKDRVINLSVSITEAKMLSPDALFIVGTWTALVSGTYMTIFVRQGSDWRIRADTWNGD
jgi:uncharacterized protein (TIGR02246 family)